MCQHGLNVSMAVSQLRCDRFVVFSAREIFILNLRSPGVTKNLKINEAGLSFRRANPEPTRVMELELPHSTGTEWCEISGFAGIEDC